MIEFFLRYNRLDITTQIDQPKGFDNLEIGIEQDYVARDISIKDFKISFIRKPFNYGHDFNNFINEFKSYGFESDIDLVVNSNGVLWFVGSLDFTKATTNFSTYIDVELSIKSVKKEIKDNEDTLINLDRVTNLYGDAITPLILEDATLRPSLIDFSVRLYMNDYEGNRSDSVSMLLSPTVVTDDYYFIPLFGYVDNPITNFNSFIPYVGSVYKVFKSSTTNIFETGTNELVSGTPLYVMAENIINSGYYYYKTGVDAESSNVNMYLSARTTLNGIMQSSTLVAIVCTYTDETYTIIDKITTTSIYSGEIRGGFSSTILSINGASVAMPAYSKIVLVWSVYMPSNSPFPLTITNGVVNVIEPEEGSDVPTKIASIYNFADAILNNITKSHTLSSDYLTGRYANLYLTNGFNIRGFFNKSIKIKWKEFKEFLFAALNCDVAINNEDIFIGNYREFYKDVQIASFDCGEPNDLKIEFNKDSYINGLELNYKFYENDDKDSTIDAFCTETSWKFKNNKVNKIEKRDIPFAADSRSIEYSKRDYVSIKPTMSKTTDDKIFMLDVIEIDGVKVNRQGEGFDSINGILRINTESNVRFSPKRLIMDNYLEWLRMVSYYITTDQILENTAIKINSSLSTIANNTIDTFQGYLVESEPILDNTPALVSPLVYSFDVPLKLSLEQVQSLFDAIVNQRGYIMFNLPDISLKLYPMEGTVYNIKEKRLKFVGNLKT